jgi:hypothetical protein
LFSVATQVVDNYTQLLPSCCAGRRYKFIVVMMTKWQALA